MRVKTAAHMEEVIKDQHDFFVPVEKHVGRRIIKGKETDYESINTRRKETKGSGFSTAR